jgi:hypothetical protein
MFEKRCVSRLAVECASLDVSQSYEPLRPVTGIALPFLHILLLYYSLMEVDIFKILKCHQIETPWFT